MFIYFVNNAMIHQIVVYKYM